MKRYIFEETPNDKAKKEKITKEKEKIDQQKADFQQQKLDFQKQKMDYSKDKDYEKGQEEKEQGEDQNEKQKDDPEIKPNINFKNQGKFYEDVYPDLRNLTLADGNLLDDEERNYIALAVQAAEGRLDKGFEKFLKKGKAGNVYGKDFSDSDIQKIIEYCKKHELVR
jgi:hypothetical protein